MTLITHVAKQKTGTNYTNLEGAYACDNCSGMSVAWTSVQHYSNNPANADLELSRTGQWAPTVLSGKAFPDVPEHIASAANEAYVAESVDALRGAILLARTVIEATAKEKGILSGTLFAKIDELAKQGFIRDIIRDGAHQVRLLGNDMAHGDIQDPVGSDDVNDVLQLMSLLLQEVFQTQALIDGLKARHP